MEKLIISRELDLEKDHVTSTGTTFPTAHVSHRWTVFCLFSLIFIVERVKLEMNTKFE